MTATDLLHRSATDARVAGVCGGIAERYRIDPLLVRVVAVVVALSSGVGLVLYGAAWLLLPRGSQRPAVERVFPSLVRVRPQVWVVLVGGAALVVLVMVGAILNASLMPTMLVLGVLYVSQLRPGHRPMPPPPHAMPRPPYSSPTTRPEPGLASQWPLFSPPRGELVVTTPAGPWRPTNRWGQPLSAQECSAFYAVADPVGLYESRPVAAPQTRSRVIAVVAGLVTAAFFAMLSLLGAFVQVPTVTYLATGLVLVGGALIVGAFVARPRGFIAIAIALVLLAGLVTESRGGPVSQGMTFSAASQIDTQVQVDGDYSLDLSTCVVDADRHVAIQVTGGDATIVLPPNGNVQLTWNDQWGDVTMPDGPAGSSGSYGAVTDPAAPTLTLVVTVTVGNLAVRR